MNKLKKYFSLAIVFLGAINLDQASLAQFPPAFPYVSPPVPSHDIMFPSRDRVNSTPASATSSTPSTPTQESSNLDPRCVSYVQAAKKTLNENTLNSQRSWFLQIGETTGRAMNDLAKCVKKGEN
jgi:hypothetical protein